MNLANNFISNLIFAAYHTIHVGLRYAKDLGDLCLATVFVADGEEFEGGHDFYPLAFKPYVVSLINLLTFLPFLSNTKVHEYGMLNLESPRREATIASDSSSKDSLWTLPSSIYLLIYRNLDIFIYSFKFQPRLSRPIII